MKTAIEMHVNAGDNIAAACEAACAKAKSQNRDVTFHFNEVDVLVAPGDTPKAAHERWRKDTDAAHEKYINSPEYKQEQARRQKEHADKIAAVMVETASTEKEMRAAEAPWPLTEKQLADYIASLVNRNHDYGTCVYAISLAAVAAFNYVAGKVGGTGFQAGCADLDILRRTRGMEGPFIVLKAEDALFPQYDLPEKLAKAMEEWKPWLKEQAAKKLKEKETWAHPDVVEHWMGLVGSK